MQDAVVHVDERESASGTSARDRPPRSGDAISWFRGTVPRVVPLRWPIFLAPVASVSVSRAGRACAGDETGNGTDLRIINGFAQQRVPFSGTDATADGEFIRPTRGSRTPRETGILPRN